MKILTEESPNNDEQFLSDLPLKRKSNRLSKNKSSINDIIMPEPVYCNIHNQDGELIDKPRESSRRKEKFKSQSSMHNHNFKNQFKYTQGLKSENESVSLSKANVVIDDFSNNTMNQFMMGSQYMMSQSNGGYRQMVNNVGNDAKRDSPQNNSKQQTGQFPDNFNMNILKEVIQIDKQ